MPPAHTQRSATVRALMRAHLAQRLAKKNNKHQKTKPAPGKETIQAAQEEQRLSEILQKGRKSVSSVTVATHIAKGIHPDPKIHETTNLNLGPGELESLPEVGSHLVPYAESPADTTGNAAYNTAAYELYLLLDLKFEGKSLCQWLDEHDPDIVLAFTQDFTEETDKLAFASQFKKLMNPKVRVPASSKFAKQLYWPVDDDEGPVNDSAYHLLAPLYPASLVHQIYGRIQEDRFGEANKAARKARRENTFYEGMLREYPDLAVQKLGGTKPLNISQLNNERSGKNYLLSCAPPSWKPAKQRGLFKTSSIFDHIYGHIPMVSKTIHDLRKFLEKDPSKTSKTRNERDRYTAMLIGELVHVAAGYQQGLAPGWSLSPQTELNEDECLWLDPYRATFEDEHDFREKWLRMDWPEKIGERFARWVNSKLDGKLSFGDVEFRHWKKALLLDESEFGWARELHNICREIHQKRKKLSGARGEYGEEITKETEAAS